MSTEGLLEAALDEVHADLVKYVRFPSPEGADAVTLWIAASHCQPLWEHASRLVIKSPVKRCGKTRLAEVIRELVHRAEVAGSTTAAVLVRVISDADPPTIILDEADVVFKKRSNGDDSAEALRQILNLGHSRGWPYKRWDVKRREVELCPTFAMALIAGIGDMPDTIEDRAVVITMQRRAPGEQVAEFRRRNIASLHSTRTALEHALRLTLNAYTDYEPPPLPVSDRAADVWEPLVAVADTAGGTWPSRARAACLALTIDAEDDQSLSLRLLADLAAIWDDAEHLATATVIDRLAGLDESPWADYFGRRITPRDLARLLRPYQVRSRTVRLAEGLTAKGYSRADLYPVWTRYARTSEDPSQASQESQPTIDVTEIPRLTRNVTDVTEVTDIETREPGMTNELATAETNLRAAGIDFNELPDPYGGTQ